MYVVWSDRRNGGDDDVYFNYSQNHGATWLATSKRLDTDSPGSGYFFYPIVNCDGSGHVYALWQDNRSGGYDTYFNYSHNHGATWQVSDMRLNSVAGKAMGPEISSDENGYVYVAWFDSRFAPFDIFFNYSSNYGATWQTSDIMVNASAGPARAPYVSCNENGYVYIVWRDLENGREDIYYNYSSNHGATWQASDRRLDTDTAGAKNSQDTRISSDESGNVYVVWKDERNGKYDIYSNYSSNHGATWQLSDTRVNTDAAGTKDAYTPSIDCDNNGSVYIVWFDDRNGKHDVYFAGEGELAEEEGGAIFFGTQF